MRFLQVAVSKGKFIRQHDETAAKANVALVAHCDWSKDAKKRWMCLGVAEGETWRVLPPEPVGESATLFERLLARRQAQGAVLAGFDFSIGVPRAYARLAGLPGFRPFLERLGRDEWGRWFDGAERKEEIGLFRPFYPVRPGGAKLEHLTAALGLEAPVDLLRLCERATAERPAGSSLFWTLGSNQVGKASVAGWREVIIPNLPNIGLWPFDGDLGALAAENDVVVAETYPADVYRRLGFPRRGWSKRNRIDRIELGEAIRGWLDERPYIDAEAAEFAIAEGFGEDRHGEDRFDALIGLLGMIEVVLGHRPAGTPNDEAVRTWEGWILGHLRNEDGADSEFGADTTTDSD